MQFKCASLNKSLLLALLQHSDFVTALQAIRLSDGLDAGLSVLVIVRRTKKEA